MFIERPKLDEPPPRGTIFYCGDWQCPAAKSCARHFGRSYAYAAMLHWADGKDETPFFTPTRPPFADQCEHYDLDRPREWLAGWCEALDQSWCCVGCECPECPRSLRKVVSLADRRRPADKRR